jgi:hypothetical protein
VARAVLVGSVTPLMLKTKANPEGQSLAVFDEIRAGVIADRSQFFKDLALPFYGANRPGAEVSQGVRDAFWRQGMQGSLKCELDCIKAFSETDLTEDLAKFDVPTLIIHGDDDQIVPIGASAHATSRLIKGATLKIYRGGPHGLADVRRDELNADLLAFIVGDVDQGRLCGWLSSALTMRTISLAMSSGERMKSMHPLAIALSGMSGCAAVSSFCAMVIPPTSLMPQRAAAPSPS